MTIRLKNESLKKYTSFKIGGSAEILSTPKDINELLSEIRFCDENNIPCKILGNGSNILVSDKGVKGFVISLKRAFNGLSLIDKYRVEVGSGVLLQKFINFSINNNLFGNELLYSIPGTIGGAIYMNAGIGNRENVKASISDYLVSVTIFDGSKIKILKKEDCNFGYRKSIFKKKRNWIILSAIFELPFQEKTIGFEKKKARMKYAIKHQDRKYPSVGSIFYKDYGRIASSVMSGRRYGNAMFSKRNGNWIINIGNATSKEVKILIRVAQILNFFFTFKKALLEVEIWE